MSSRNACRGRDRSGSAPTQARVLPSRIRLASSGLGLVLGLLVSLGAATATAESAAIRAPQAGATRLESADVRAGNPAPVAVVDEPILLAQEGGTVPRELEPRYPAPPPGEPGPYSEEGAGYNASYIFGMTRGVAASTMVPAAKVPLFVLTVPLDIVFLPFAVIGGFFG